MGLLDFFRGKPKGLSIDALYDPQRFAEFTPSQLEDFVGELSLALERLNLRVKRTGPAEIELEAPSMTLFLDNLANDWYHTELKDRNQLIHNHLVKSLSSYGRREFSKVEAIENICIRCYADFSNKDDQFYVETIADSFHLVIAVNLDETFIALNKRDTVNWGLDISEIWKVAYSKACESNELELIKKGKEDNIAVYVLDHKSAPAIAYRLIETDSSFRGKLGAFWIPLSTSIAVAIPVHDEKAIDLANENSELISITFLEDDRPISIDLFWWRGDGEWLRIPALQGLNKNYYYELPE
jgi:hypothetical protein